MPSPKFLFLHFRHVHIIARLSDQGMYLCALQAASKAGCKLCWGSMIVYTQPALLVLDFAVHAPTL